MIFKIVGCSYYDKVGQKWAQNHSEDQLLLFTFYFHSLA